VSEFPREVSITPGRLGQICLGGRGFPRVIAWASAQELGQIFGSRVQMKLQLVSSPNYITYFDLVLKCPTFLHNNNGAFSGPEHYRAGLDNFSNRKFIVSLTRVVPWGLLECLHVFNQIMPSCIISWSDSKLLRLSDGFFCRVEVRADRQGQFTRFDNKFSKLELRSS
jgi:hypothetical protein